MSRVHFQGKGTGNGELTTQTAVPLTYRDPEMLPVEKPVAHSLKRMSHKQMHHLQPELGVPLESVVPTEGIELLQFGQQNFPSEQT